MSVRKKFFMVDDSETIIQLEIERLKTFKDHPSQMLCPHSAAAVKIFL